MEIIYPLEDDVVEYNQQILERIKVKKADKHELWHYSRIQKTINEAKLKKGDIYDKAVVLIKGLIRSHPFASGNRRTALGITEKFLRDNGQKMYVNPKQDQTKILLGIRERYYTTNEIKNWMKGKSIRGFSR